MTRKGKNKAKRPKRKKLPDDHPFSKLQNLKDEILQSPQREPAKRNEATSRSSSEKDKDTPAVFDFEEEMDDVKPISRDRPRVPKKPVHTALNKRPHVQSDDEKMLKSLDLWVGKQLDFRLADDAERIEGAISGLSPRVRKKLRQGGFAVQAHLDLHGLDSSSAFEATQNFIMDAMKDGLRCVLIIHGKGLHSKTHEPVIKNLIKKWLTRGTIGRCVLAFTTAQPGDGGHGAVYTLLRKTSASGDGKKALLKQE